MIERKVPRTSPRAPQEEQRDLAKTIRVSGSIQLSTVSNILDFYKMEAGKQLDIVRAEVDIQVWTLTLTLTLTPTLTLTLSGAVLHRTCLCVNAMRQPAIWGC